VLNKLDQNPSFDVNRKFLQEKYQGIQSFHKISCEKRTGLTELTQQIHQSLKEKIPLIRAKLPNTWFNIKTDLEQLSKENHFIEYSEFRKRCQQQAIDDETTQAILAQYLNDLGVIIHFDEDSELVGTPVLNPHWITQAVYKIINYKSVSDAHGLFYLKDLAIVLAKKTATDFYYPKEKYTHIIQLMKKFEICYATDKQHILIPDLLEIQEPEFEFDDRNKEAVRFRIRYQFLSKLIMPSFIVKRHGDIKEQLRWRTGVVLEDKSLAACAVVKADYQEKWINIIVTGKEKRDFFAVIRKTFKEIHQRFNQEKFEFTEYVLLPDEPSHDGIEYQELLGYEQAGKDEYFVGKLGKTYSVSALLDGIEKLDQQQQKRNIYVTGDYIQNTNDMVQISHNIDNMKNEIEESEKKKNIIMNTMAVFLVLSIISFIIFSNYYEYNISIKYSLYISTLFSTVFRSSYYFFDKLK
jgi:hypothetical protein